jgi:TPR repeat protein
VIRQNFPLSAHYLKLAADEGSIESQLEDEICLLRSDGVSINRQECEDYLREAVK